MAAGQSLRIVSCTRAWDKDSTQPGFKVESGGLSKTCPDRETPQLSPTRATTRNLMIAGLHAAFLLFHNKAIDLVTNNAVKLSYTESRPGEPTRCSAEPAGSLDGSPWKRASRRYW